MVFSFWAPSRSWGCWFHSLPSFKKKTVGKTTKEDSRKDYKKEDSVRLMLGKGWSSSENWNHTHGHKECRLDAGREGELSI